MLEHGATTDVETAISQLRAQGIPALYAHQALTQIGDLKDLMKINAMNRLLPRTQEPDASEYARQYPNSGLRAADITGQDPDEHQYAMFVAEGKPAGPLSLIPLPWPQPVTADLEPDPDGADWQQHLPTERHPLDHLLLTLVYGPIPDRFATVQALEHMPDDAWVFLKQRWEVIRQVQRQYILDHPACIPDRMQRQRWLSRLRAATPLVIVATDYGRIRALLDPDGRAARDREEHLKQKRSRGSRSGEPSERTVLQQVDRDDGPTLTSLNADDLV